MEDFVNEELVEFEIEGKKFAYKPVTAGEELKWVAEYIEIIDGKTIQNFEKKTICKLRNLKIVPYDQATIKKIIGLDKSWENLNKDGRWTLLSKLKPNVFNQIIIKINSIDSGDEVKKN